MHFVFDLLQAAGITAAIGVRPLMPTLLAGGLASADAGIDFDGTDYAFLEEPWCLAVVTVLVLALWVATRRAPPEVLERGWAAYAIAAISGPLALLEGAGTMADGGHPAWIGMVVGLACVSLGLAAAASLVVGILYLVFGRQLLAFAGAVPGTAIADMANVFLSVSVFTAPLLFAYSIHSDTLRTEGKVGFIALVGVAVTLANIGLNYVLIAWCHLGVAGGVDEEHISVFRTQEVFDGGHVLGPRFQQTGNIRRLGQGRI